MGNVSRPRWIIQNFISPLSQGTLPLLAKNPAPQSPEPALDATGSAPHRGIAHKGLLGFAAQFAMPPSQHIGPNPQLPSDLAHRHPWCGQHRRRFTLILGRKLPSCSRDTPPGPLGALSQVFIKSGQTPCLSNWQQATLDSASNPSPSVSSVQAYRRDSSHHE